MICQVIDLYEYFKIQKPQGARAELTVYSMLSYQENDIGRTRPAMLVIPGGGYHFVSDREAEPVAIAWLAKGYNAFVLRYSVSPLYYPTQLSEACMAMLYIRENAQSLCVDPDHVCAVGFSAGGHLCATLASISDNQDMVKIFGEERAKNTRPNAVILSYGVVSYDNCHTHSNTFHNVTAGNYDMIDMLDPAKIVHKNSSPAFLWHTRRDTIVPFENSVSYALASHKAGVPTELHIFDDGDHGLSLATGETEGFERLKEGNKSAAHWVDLAYLWLERVLGFSIKYSK